MKNEVKKDHSIGAGTGAGTGAAAGAIIGAAAGPIGAAIGAVIGAIGGAKAGDELAELVNPTEYDDHWQKEYTKTSYYNPNRTWDDYAPAYGMGYHAKGANRQGRFEDLDDKLEAKWSEVKGKSRLEWLEAKDAVRDGWHHVERALPGDADGDGR